MTGQNGNADLDKILLVDSYLTIDSLKDKATLYQKIITFDFDSHKLLTDYKISHEISDKYLSRSELDEIQKKTYKLSKWSKQKEISTLIEYDGINLGNLTFNDFINFIGGFLKKFYEIKKIIQQNENHEFIATPNLLNVLRLFTNGSKLQDEVIASKDEAIKYSYRIGQKSISVVVSKEKYLKLKNITETFFQKFFQSDKPQNGAKYVVLTEFDPTKYKTLLLASKNLSQNLLLYNRRWPSIWNLESFNVMRKSKCRVATFNTLVNDDLQIKIEKAKDFVGRKLQDLWKNDFFKSFFSFNSVSFWEPMRPFFEDLVTLRMKEAIQEIEIAKKLFEKYTIKTILVLSEIGPNEQIMIHLAKKNGIPVILMQHGVPYETPEATERNNLSGVFPNLSDAMIVWGDLTKRYLENSGIDSFKLKPLGSLIYDDLFKKNITKEETILLTTSPPMKDLVYDNLIETNERYQNAIEKICKIVIGLNQKLVIKLHPSLVDFDIETMTSKISNNIMVVKSGSIFPLIENCKLLLTFDLSTTILEAQILKKPAISISLKDYGFGESEIFKTKSCIKSSIEDLEQILNKILTDDSYKQELIKNGSNFVEKYLTNRGMSNKEILNFLKKL